jgi:hypothetical protein
MLTWLAIAAVSLAVGYGALYVTLQWIFPPDRS